jgi:uncharacterized caspase-like protein
VKPGRILLLTAENATGSLLNSAFAEDVPQLLKSGAGKVYIYFSGHGTTVGKNKPALLPWDGKPGKEATVYPLDRVIEQAKTWKAERTFVMLDACYMGDRRSASEPGRPGVRPDMEEIGASDKCLVLTASGADQSAQDLDSLKHGLFTYYLLKGLKGDANSDNDDWISFQELYNYVRANVSAEAAETLRKTQEPTVLPEGIEKSAAGWRIVKSR